MFNDNPRSVEEVKKSNLKVLELLFEKNSKYMIIEVIIIQLYGNKYLSLFEVFHIRKNKKSKDKLEMFETYITF